MNEEERYKAVAACKWVDEVVKGAPYVTSLAVLDQYNVDFCVHGDDIVTSSDGTDTYWEVKKAGRFRTVPRTPGVSTTDLVGRMLLMTKTHHQQSSPEGSPIERLDLNQVVKQKSPYTTVSHFLPTTRKIVQFSEGREPKPGDKVVYIDGTWDLFHVGHIEVLKAAKELGDYLLVGVHDDKSINQIKGSNFPLTNLHERVLSVLSCRYVDEVIIGAPYSVTKEMIEQAHISLVVHGTDEVTPALDGSDPYKVPKAMGIFQTIQSPSDLSTTTIIQRIIDNRLQYEARNKKKEAKEIAEIQQRTQTNN
jgi:ethanolamine-phosphate cytidylyltransferase